MEQTEAEKFWKAFEVIAIAGILLGFLAVLFFLRDLLTPFIIAFVLFFFLNPVVDWIEGNGIGRTYAVLMLVAAGLLLVILLGMLVWPKIEAEISSFKDNAPAYMQKVESGLKNTALAVEKKMTFIPKGTLTKLVAEKIKTKDILVSVGSNMDAILGFLMELATDLILIPFVVFFLLKDGRSIKKAMIAFIPNKYFETFLCLLYEVHQQITKYIRGQLIDAFIVGALSIAGLYLMGIKYAIVIGLIGGIGNIIPYVGPLAGMAAGSLIVLIDSGSVAGVIKIIGLFLAVQLIDEALISPLAVGKSVDVHPVMVVIAILIGGLFLGAWGMLLAVPLYCSLKVSSLILYSGFVEYGNW